MNRNKYTRRELILTGKRILSIYLPEIERYTGRTSEEYRRKIDFEEMCIATAIVYLNMNEFGEL